MEISTIGIDLSKTTFHLIGLNTRGEIVLRRKFSRKQHGIEVGARTHFGLQAQGAARRRDNAFMSRGLWRGRALRTRRKFLYQTG